MLDRLELLIGKDNIELLETKKVLVLGLGGVGGYVVESLARSGIGSLVLVDYDTITESNLNRQIIATRTNMGQLKTDAFEKRILDINPKCKIEKLSKMITPDHFYELLSYQPDFIVDACDTISVKQECIKACIQNKIPFLSCMGTGNKMDPSKLKILDLKKTEGDPIAKKLRKYVKDERINGKIPVICSTELPRRKGKVIASNAFVPPTAGLLAGNYVVRYLIGDYHEKER